MKALHHHLAALAMAVAAFAPASLSLAQPSAMPPPATPPSAMSPSATQPAPSRPSAPQACLVAAQFAKPEFPLARVAKAIAEKKLTVAVVGTLSSTLGGSNGAAAAYPARLQTALAERLPDVAVAVTALSRPRTTAVDMQKDIREKLDDPAVDLIVWQTGTVEVVRHTNAEDFRNALNDSVDASRAAGRDILLMNMQFTPRMDSLMDVMPYADEMRFVALQQQILLFDRLAIMRHWSELGTFDLYAATKKRDLAEQVHDCLGHLLADMIVDAARESGSGDRTDGRPQ